MRGAHTLPHTTRPGLSASRANETAYLFRLQAMLLIDAMGLKFGGLRVVVLPDANSGQLIADVQLFSDSYAPRYGVLLGKLRGGAS